MADPPVIKPPPAGASCRIRHCELWPEASGPFCHSHNATWRANGRPEIDTFAARFDPGRVVPADQSIQLGQLPPQLRLELQYTLQQRRDRRVGKLAPSVVTRVVRLLAASSVASLLDHDEDTGSRSADGTVNDSLGRALLLYARRAVADLAETGGWEAEYPRDVWRMHRLGFDGRRTLQFDRITQPWLRELAKRWVRLRLSSGLGLEAGGARAVVRDQPGSRGSRPAVGVEPARNSIGSAARTLSGRPGAERQPQRRGAHIGLLNGFFAAIRQHRWYQGFPPTALFFPEDYPRRPDELPRALAEQVMAQLEHPANLDRFDNPAYRLITVILMRCGLRVTDALRLPQRLRHHRRRRRPLPALLQPQDAPRRPRPDRRPNSPTHRLISGGRIRTLARRHRSCSPAATKNIDGHPRLAPRPTGWPCSAGSHVCDIRDEHGRPGASDPAPMAPHPRHPADQPRRPARDRPPHPRPRLDRR